MREPIAWRSSLFLRNRPDLQAGAARTAETQCSGHAGDPSRSMLAIGGTIDMTVGRGRLRTVPDPSECQHPIEALRYDGLWTDLLVAASISCVKARGGCGRTFSIPIRTDVARRLGYAEVGEDLPDGDADVGPVAHGSNDEQGAAESRALSDPMCADGGE